LESVDDVGAELPQKASGFALAYNKLWEMDRWRAIAHMAWAQDHTVTMADSSDI